MPIWIACAVAALCAVPGSALAADAYENFRSELRSLDPPVSGLTLKVVRGDEALQLQNKSGKTVIVEGYDGEQYLRFLPNGTVEANQRSAATYINVDRYGQQEIPDNAIPGVKPVWKPVAGDGSYTWFDHRIHLTAKEPPARFTSSDKPKKVLDWKVPMTAGGRSVEANGSLTWVPPDDSSSTPWWLIILIGLALAGVLAYLLLRRRGARSPRPARDKPAGEAW
jgi:hypothetical protein